MGQFKILDKLGEGGMGVVFRGLQVELNREVAIKFLPERYSHDKVYVSRFNREVKAVIQLSHPNIVKILEQGEKDGQLYYVMELILGEALSSYIHKKAPMPTRHSFEILHQLLDALAYCHERGFVHRDVKPANVMVRDDRHVTLMDFGLVKGEMNQTVLTQQGRVLGTPQFMAPEILLGKSTGPATDVWAAGGILFQMLTGKHLFEAFDLQELAMKILNEPVPEISALRPELKDPYVAFIHRLLEKDPDDRFPDAQEAFSQLLILEEEAGHPSRARTTKKTQKAEILKVTKAPVPALSTIRVAAQGARGRALVLSFLVGGMLVFLVGLKVRDQSGHSIRPPQAVMLRVSPYPMGFRVEWESETSYPGQVVVVNGSGVQDLKAKEEWPTTHHTLMVHPVASEKPYVVQAVRPPGEEVARVTASPLGLGNLGKKVRETIWAFDPIRLKAEFTKQFDELKPSERRRGSPVLARMNERWNGILKTRFAEYHLAEALLLLESLEDRFLSCAEIPASHKVSLMEAVEDLDILSSVLKAREFSFPYDLTRIGSESFGPVALPLRELDEAWVLTFNEETDPELAARFKVKRAHGIPGERKRPVDLLDFSRVSPALNERLGPWANHPLVRVEFPDPLPLRRSDTRKVVEVGVLVKYLDVVRRLQFELAPDGGAFTGVASLNGLCPDECLLFYRLDQRLLGQGTTRVAVRLITPLAWIDEAIKLKAVVVRVGRE